MMSLIRFQCNKMSVLLHVWVFRSLSWLCDNKDTTIFEQNIIYSYKYNPSFIQLMLKLVKYSVLYFLNQ